MDLNLLFEVLFEGMVPDSFPTDPVMDGYDNSRKIRYLLHIAPWIVRYPPILSDTGFDSLVYLCDNKIFDMNNLSTLTLANKIKYIDGNTYPNTMTKYIFQTLADEEIIEYCTPNSVYVYLSVIYSRKELFLYFLEKIIHGDVVRGYFMAMNEDIKNLEYIDYIREKIVSYYTEEDNADVSLLIYYAETLKLYPDVPIDRLVKMGTYCDKVCRAAYYHELTNNRNNVEFILRVIEMAGMGYEMFKALSMDFPSTELTQFLEMCDI